METVDIKMQGDTDDESMPEQTGRENSFSESSNQGQSLNEGDVVVEEDGVSIVPNQGESIRSNQDDAEVEGDEASAGPNQIDECPYEYVRSKKRNGLLLYHKGEEQLYVKKSVDMSTDVKRFVCYQKHCKARAILRDGVFYRNRSNTPHTHARQHTTYADLMALNSIKDKVNDIATTGKKFSIREVFNEQCAR